MGFSGINERTLVRFLASDQTGNLKLLTTFGIIAGEVVLPKDCRETVPIESMFAADVAESGGSGAFPTGSVLLRNVHVTAAGGNRFTFSNLVVQLDQVIGITLG